MDFDAQKHGMNNNQELWNEFLKRRDDHNRNQLIYRYIYLVKDIAERLHSKLTDDPKLLVDLISAGIFGLMDAIEDFDPAKHGECVPYTYSTVITS
jgi:RNA polymerase sigma factor for flagellar operon FliA